MPAEAIIVFDGVCVLCNASVQFVIARDRQRRFRFAAAQSSAGRALLVAHGLDPAAPASFLLLDDGVAWRDSAAAVRVLRRLDGAWPLLGRLAQGIPAGLRDAMYRWIARNRYRWFGQRESCMLPTPEDRARFIE